MEEEGSQGNKRETHSQEKNSALHDSHLDPQKLLLARDKYWERNGRELGVRKQVFLLFFNCALGMDRTKNWFLTLSAGKELLYTEPRSGVCSCFSGQFHFCLHKFPVSPMRNGHSVVSLTALEAFWLRFQSCGSPTCIFLLYFLGFIQKM